ncbi:MAG TPA: hypothetical protein VN886_14365 [Acidimicrobiales bacterium]|nr:hypothetical protein [Acidimicrobiales bacterium]
MKALDALVGRVEFDVIGEFGVEVPLRTIGFLFGIPEADQLAYRQRTDEALTTDSTPIAFDQSSFSEVPVCLGPADRGVRFRAPEGRQPRHQRRVSLD